jgi:hypothetical protein
MKKSILVAIALLINAVIQPAFISMDGDVPEITGEWIRTTDALRIRITPETDKQFHSFIIDEGNGNFPCEVSDLPIYKNIVQIKGKLWRCDFLVVTMGSCATDYEEGIIQLVKNGDMEITCPGFEKKIYRKQKPRYEN